MISENLQSFICSWTSNFRLVKAKSSITLFFLIVFYFCVSEMCGYVLSLRLPNPDSNLTKPSDQEESEPKAIRFNHWISQWWMCTKKT